MKSDLHTPSELAAYLSELPRGGVAGFARQLGISRVYLSQLAARTQGRAPGPSLCVAIERESGGQVRRWRLRQADWHLIWPELVGTEGAPAPQQQQEARDAA